MLDMDVALAECARKMSCMQKSTATTEKCERMLVRCCRPNGAGETGTSAGAEESKQLTPNATAADEQATAAHVKPEPATVLSAAEQAASTDTSAAAVPEADLKMESGAGVKEEAGTKQEGPSTAANRSSAVKAEPLNGKAELVTAAAGSQSNQHVEMAEGSAQIKAEPDAKAEAGMQNGLSAAKPEQKDESQKQDGTGMVNAGHESDDESDLEDEEEEHEDQVWCLSCIVQHCLRLDC